MTTDTHDDAGAQPELSPEDAEAQIAELELDSEHQAALYSQHHPAHQEAVAKQARLYEAAYPDDGAGEPEEAEERFQSALAEGEAEADNAEDAERALERIADNQLAGDIPDHADDYRLADTLPQSERGEPGMDAVIGWAQTTLHEAGLTGSEARQIAMSAQQIESPPDDDELEALNEATRQELVSELGSNAAYDKAVAEARELIAEIDTDGTIRRMLADTGLGSDPATVRAFIAAAARRNHGTIPF